MGTGPKPYQVVYDTDNGFQYVFESGNIAIPGTITPAGDSGQVQFNDNGEFAGTAGLVIAAGIPTAKEELDVQEILAGDGTYLAFLAASGTPVAQLSSDGGDPKQDFYIATKGVGQNVVIDTHVTSGSVVIAGVGGSTTSSASALVSISSVSQGFLPPVMTNTQRDAIASPAEGLTIYSTSDHTLEFYNGSVWKKVATV